MFNSIRGKLLANISNKSDNNIYLTANIIKNLSSFGNSNYVCTSLKKSVCFNKTHITKSIRQSSRIAPTLHHVPISVASKDEKREFMAIFPDVVRDLTEDERFADLPDMKKRLAKVLQYNVPGGKKNRGLAIVLAYRMLAPSSQLTPENIRMAQILGWCVEMMHAFFLVVDDIIDQSITRRGRPCWYRNPDIGLLAVNDGIFIESGLFQLLRRHFQDKPYYMKFVDLMHDAIMKTVTGQALDMSTASTFSETKLEKYTMDRYSSIVKYKTSYYSFHLPVALAMYMAGIEDKEKHRQAKTILLEIGHFFQVQDDYIDMFGDPEKSGKIGTDVIERKCSWLIVVALQRATPTQRKQLEDYLGSSDPNRIEKVKSLYEQLGIPATFATYEEESYNLIQTHIQQISAGLSHDLFFKLLDKIYRREN